MDLLRNSLQNVRTIIWLLLCYNIAIIQIMVETDIRIMCKETLIKHILRFLLWRHVKGERVLMYLC